RLLAGTGTCGGYGTRLARSFSRRTTPYNELTRRTKTNASALFRLLRALESIGIFTQTSPRVFGNTPTSKCLRKDVRGSQWPLVLQNLSKGNGPFEAWDELAYAVRTGEPSLDRIYGHDYWEFLRRNPQANAAMNEAMRSMSRVMTPAVTAAYKWSQFPVIADIGGGIGTQLVSILDASPSSKGILFDQPRVGAESISHNRYGSYQWELLRACADGCRCVSSPLHSSRLGRRGGGTDPWILAPGYEINRAADGDRVCHSRGTVVSLRQVDRLADVGRG